MSEVEEKKNEEQERTLTVKIKEISFAQILNVPFEWNGRECSQLYGLSKEGVVYKFVFRLQGWARVPMKVVKEDRGFKVVRGKTDYNTGLGPPGPYSEYGDEEGLESEMPF